MTKHKLWYVPMSHEYGYAHAEFFTSKEDAEKFLESFEDSDGDEESRPTSIRHQGACELEFEINDKGELVI